MKIYEVTKLEDGSVKVESILSPEETKFMLEFALVNLLARGCIPVSAKEYYENHKEEIEDENQKNYLAAVDPSKIPQS